MKNCIKNLLIVVCIGLFANSMLVQASQPKEDQEEHSIKKSLKKHPLLTGWGISLIGVFSLGMYEWYAARNKYYTYMKNVLAELKKRNRDTRSNDDLTKYGDIREIMDIYKIIHKAEIEKEPQQIATRIRQFTNSIDNYNAEGPNAGAASKNGLSPSLINDIESYFYTKNDRKKHDWLKVNAIAQTVACAAVAVGICVALGYGVNYTSPKFSAKFPRLTKVKDGLKNSLESLIGSLFSQKA